MKPWGPEAVTDWRADMVLLAVKKITLQPHDSLIQQIPELFTWQILINSINNRYEFLSFGGTLHYILLLENTRLTVPHEITMFYHYFTASGFTC